MRIIAGEWRGRRLKTPRGDATRPTSDRVREAWFSIVGHNIAGASVLDLFSGSGALGLEALSRGAASVVFVEKARAALDALRANIATLGVQDASTVIRGDAMRYARGLDAHTFDLAFADPPYDRGLAGELLIAHAEVPFSRELWVEHRTHETLPVLPGTSSRRYGDTTLTLLPSSQGNE